MTTATASAAARTSTEASRAIDIDAVSYAYPQRRQPVPAVGGVSMSLGPGQLGVLLGPSGCGKSTLLRIAAGLVQPDAGRISFSGATSAELRAERRIGFAFQDPSLLPWRTVRRNIELPFDLSGRPRDAAWVDHLLAITKLTEWAKHRPRQLSGGMKQRVSLARALATRPQILLLDEPFGALDELTRGQLNLELLTILADTGTTCLMVTHSVEEAVLVGDKIMVLSARPCTEQATHTVDVTRLKRRDFRDTAEFAGHCREIRRSLEQPWP
jgi:NitT/TauT family transport system ATP-binding protein